MPVSNEPNIIVPTSVGGDPLVGLSRVDLLLTDSGDLAMNNFGDFRLSAGITNIVQALKIKFSTQRGTMILHPEFGLGLKVGIMSSEVDTQEIFNSISKMIEDDSRFSGISGLRVDLNGPTLSISLGVTIAGQSGVFPITFEL